MEELMKNLERAVELDIPSTYCMQDYDGNGFSFKVVPRGGTPGNPNQFGYSVLFWRKISDQQMICSRWFPAKTSARHRANQLSQDILTWVSATRTKDTPRHDQVSLADLNHGYLSTQAIPKAEKYGTFEFCIALNNRSDVKCKIIYNQSKAYSLRLTDYDTEFDKTIDISVSSKWSILTIGALFKFLIERYIYRDYGCFERGLGFDHTYCKCSMDEEKPDYEQKYWDCQRWIDEYEREIEDLNKRIRSRDISIQGLDEAYTACLERIDELQKENDNLRKANEGFDNANERLKNNLNTVRDERRRYEQLIKDIRIALGEVKQIFHDIDRSPYNRIIIADCNIEHLISRIKLRTCCCCRPDELSED